MPTSPPEDPESELPPPGTRWGAGAQSVLPYLARSLQARPSQAVDQRGREHEPPSGQGVFTQEPPAAD